MKMPSLPDSLTLGLLGLLFSSLSALAQPALQNGDVDFPNLAVAKAQIREYQRSGRYMVEIERVVLAARTYLEENLLGEGKPAMILDIDETSLSNWEAIEKLDFGYLPQEWERWINSARAPAIVPTLDLYHWATTHGVAVFFITGRDESERAVTERNLRSAGFEGWQELIVLPEGPRPDSIASYKAGHRKQIRAKGYRIIVNLGDQRSDLEGGYADGEFKLPNPLYYIP